MSKYSEQELLIDPISLKEYPCGPTLPGFSGGPLFTLNNELIGINDKIIYFRTFSDMDILDNIFSLAIMPLYFSSIASIFYHKIGPTFVGFLTLGQLTILGILLTSKYFTYNYDTICKDYTYSAAIPINKWYDKINSAIDNF